MDFTFTVKLKVKPKHVIALASIAVWLILTLQ
jgi:hypothetical protein